MPKITSNVKTGGQKIRSNTDIINEYDESKKKGGIEFYDYIAKNKETLKKIIKNNDDLAIIALVPSISENYAMSTDERKKRNRNLQYHPNLKGANIPEPPRVIKDVREQYLPVVSKLDDAEIRRELRSQGYINPSEEDVKAYLEKRKTEEERVKKADEWEQKNPFLKLGLSFALPRTSESLQEGYDPSMKDIGLDIAETVATSMAPGAILKSARAIKPLSKLIAKGVSGIKKYKSTGFDTANPVMGTIGQMAENAGTAGLAELPIELGLNATDKLVYSGDRSRGTDEMSLKDLKDIVGESLRGAMIAGIGSGARARNGIDPTTQAKVNKLNELENLAYPTKKENVELDKKLFDDIKELKQYDSHLNPEAEVSEKGIEDFLTTTNAQNLIKDYAKRNNVDVSTAYDVVKKQANELTRQDKQSKFIQLNDWAEPKDLSDFAKKRKETLMNELFLRDLDRGSVIGGLFDLGLTRLNNSFDLFDKDTGY